MTDLHNNPQSTLYRSRTEQKVVFFLVFMGALSLTYLLFFAIDFLPEKPETQDQSIIENEITDTDSIPMTSETEHIVVSPEPLMIIIDALDKSVPIVNPDTATINALDTALLNGVVRHPDSADFENEGTMFLFGHSSYLPNVINKNFQAFNGIQNLKWGDTIRLHSSDTEYVYQVDRVYQVKASDAEVKIERGKAKLTLSTCNTFGSKDDRYIVEASLVDSRSL